MKQTLKLAIKDRQELITGNILAIVDIDKDTLSKMIFDTAIDYMKSTGMGEDWLVLFLREPLFWSWWRQQWTLVDEVFYYKYIGYLHHQQYTRKLREIYIHAHESIDVFPDEIIYDKIHDEYNKTTSNILKKHTSTIK